ncbi:hypothetical protein VTL71DRAFT_9536 [Oculimacula yallundae]|uniref:Zn(2)-C6 fungal-type domain-containing protein n=1 Tax=Oculimacula yallundae TaxID=86028 RepID=A0ABR4BS75_9HELO
MSPDAETRHKRFRNSCDACTEAKLKCNQAKPSCRRCSHRGETCVYSQTRRVGRPPKLADQRQTIAAQVQVHGHDRTSSSALARFPHEESIVSNPIVTPPLSAANEQRRPSSSASLDMYLHGIFDHDFSSGAPLLDGYHLSLDEGGNFGLPGDFHMSNLDSAAVLEGTPSAHLSSITPQSENLVSTQMDGESSFQRRHEESLGASPSLRTGGFVHSFGQFDSILSSAAISDLNASISSLVSSQPSGDVPFMRAQSTAEHCACLGLLTRLLFIINHPALYGEENAAIDLVLFLEQSTRKGREDVISCPKCQGRSSSYTLILGMVVEWIVEQFASALESESPHCRTGPNARKGEARSHDSSHAEMSGPRGDHETISIGSFIVGNDIRIACKVELLKARLAKLADMLKAILEPREVDRSSCLGNAAGYIIRGLYDKVERAIGMAELQKF